MPDNVANDPMKTFEIILRMHVRSDNVAVHRSLHLLEVNTDHRTFQDLIDLAAESKHEEAFEKMKPYISNEKKDPESKWQKANQGGGKKSKEGVTEDS
ncbi:uncharacterized protein KY384_003960 [Bacidia gigantensis]|uniref:uncharacterized protein n=1 Tax=Bacidia gigantensis TaxID=2732470 RepID=UPI001D04EACF|nr:uncharacterized protein KY384_003960 [Bacidia gigantensis]KAG8532319.1 hypothetical protein KY384_003960 [Bacidia gigantensis]